MTIVHDCLYSVGVPTLTNILNRAENLTNPDREWLHQLVGDWQVISDVSFADLLLLVPGVNDDFVRQLSATIPDNSSALFVLLREMTTDKIGEAIQPWHPRVLNTSLSNEQETKLVEALKAQTA